MKRTIGGILNFIKKTDAGEMNSSYPKDYTQVEVEDFLGKVFASGTPRLVRYFWMDGYNYCAKDGETFVQNGDDIYYPCSILPLR